MRGLGVGVDEDDPVAQVREEVTQAPPLRAEGDGEPALRHLYLTVFSSLRSSLLWKKAGTHCIPY